MKNRICLLLAFLIAPSLTLAQDVGGVWELRNRITGPQFGGGFGNQFGISLENAGDLDGDGVEDLAVASPGFPGAPSVGPGAVFLFSGANHSFLRRLDPVPVGNRQTGFGFSLADAGDVDGDGFDDLLVGAPSSRPGPPSSIFNSGAAFLYSGSDGALLWKLEGVEENELLGASVCRVGDLDGDGLPDVAVGDSLSADPDPPRPGKVLLLRGFDGAPIRVLQSTVLGDDFGLSVAGPGDLDGDGWPDVLVGVPERQVFGDQFGKVLLFSGRDGALLREFVATGTQRSSFGRYLKVIGDLDGDGFSEWGGLVFNFSFTLEHEPDFVDLFDGFSGARLARIQGFDPDELFGFQALSMARDANGDGIADLLIGAFRGKVQGVGRPGAAYLFSTSDFHLIHRFHAIEPDDFGQFGFAVLLGSDLAGDGRSEVVVGAPLARVGDEHGVGDVRFFRFFPGLQADATRLSAS
ncbi:MAG: FG-GAP-like repeat-containing protein, partial [Planctomycetota bacterium]